MGVLCQTEMLRCCWCPVSLQVNPCYVQVTLSLIVELTIVELTRFWHHVYLLFVGLRRACILFEADACVLLFIGRRHVLSLVSLEVASLLEGAQHRAFGVVTE